MKTIFSPSGQISGVSRNLLLMAMLMLPALADSLVQSPLLEIASGLPGKQVRLTWLAEPGVRYRIEKSSDLGTGGAWSQVALVKATSTAGGWLDPEPTSTRCFYRIMQPVAEVVSISPPLLSPDGGVLVVEGQSIPPGSSLVLNVDGQLAMVALNGTGTGLWNAVVTGQFAPGASVTTVGIVDGTGVTIVTLDQPLTVSATGLALDGIPTMPPGAPVAQEQSNPIPGVGIVVKKNPGGPAERIGAGKVSMSDFSMMMATAKGSGMDSGKVSMSDFSLMRRGYEYYRAKSQLYAAKGSKKGYDYYNPKSNMSHSALQNNPAFQDNRNQGTMARTASNPLYEDNGSVGQNPLFERGPKLVKEISYARLKHPEMGNGGNAADFPCLPGEISLQTCSMTLPNPVGPPLQVVHTYRSIGTGGSGMAGSRWEMCYNISIEPVPLAAGANAPRMKIRDGAGRCDMFHRQPDGTYRCDGMFRQGSFAGNVFTLTFADSGKWTFRSLSDRKAPGKISTITCRKGVSLTCDYDDLGEIASVGKGSQTVSFTSSAPGQISRATDQTGRFVTYSYYGAGDPNGNKGDLAAISCPQVDGVPPVAGPTTFTYTTGNADPNLNGNVLSITDGAGRLLEKFTYSGETDTLRIDYDTCVSSNKTGHVTLNRREIRPGGGYTVFENDEIGRVTEVDFDRLHRAVSRRSYTGFSKPAVAVTSSTNRPTGKLNSTDPDYFETTRTYNADSLCTRTTCPDGSQKLTTYDRDFRKDCPVVERGNARVTTLRTAGGEERAVRCDFLPGFGSSESMSHEVQSPRDASSGLATGRRIVAPSKGTISISAETSSDGNISAIDDWLPPVARTSGVIAGIVLGAVVTASEGGNVDQDCYGKDDDFCTRMVTAHGQVYSASYDAQGNCTSVTSPVAGRGSIYGYNALGQCISMTTLNGPASSFQNTCSYDPVTHFLSSVTCDSTGLALTTTCARDALGRITSITDPVGNNWLYAYNPFHQCVQVQSPPLPGAPPYRIATNITYDMGSLPARCDVEHRGADGTVVATNPAYSTFRVYDSRARLVRVAEEERPVDGSGTLDPVSLGIENFSVCDITLDNAGQCVRLSTPAACRAQAKDRICDFTYNERGMIHRIILGGLGNADACTTERDYSPAGLLTRCAVLEAGNNSESLYSYDGFHRLASKSDPMGNVCTYEYDNVGYVTRSVMGEVTDVAGSVGNVLISRVRSKFEVEVQSHAISTNGAHNLCVRRPTYNFFEGWPTAFLGFESEDESITCDRFTPGVPAPFATETTTIDRSPAGLVALVTCNGDLLESCSYDTAGRLIALSDGACITTLTLDGNGSVTASTRTDLSAASGIPSENFTVSHVLDPLNRCVQTTDGTGNISACAYDSLDRLVSYTQPGGLVTRCAYDGSPADGPFSQEISADAITPGTFVMLSRSLVRSGELRSSSDSYGHLTTFTSDARGCPIRCDFPDGTFETRTYTRKIHLNTIGHVDHGRTTLTHDLNGQLTSTLTTSDPAVAPVSSTPLRTLTWDGLGRCTSVVQGAHSVGFSFDSLGNCLSETQDGRTVSHSFSHRGRTGLTYPDGRSFVETRDALGQLLTISAVSGGVPVAPPVVVNEHSGHRVVRSTQADGVVTTYQFRSDGELSLPGATDYTFDACVRTSISDLSITTVHRDRNQRPIRDATAFSAAATPPIRIKVTERNRLGAITLQATRRRPTADATLVLEGTVSYTCDLEGRRLSATGGGNPGLYTQNSALPPGDEQMGQYTTWPLGTLKWDDSGNLISMPTATGLLALTHDAEGRLTAVSRSGIPVISYDYDPLGRLVSRHPEIGAPTTFVYDGSRCIQELGADGLADLSLVCAGTIKHCISARDGTLYYPHGGATTRLMTSASGTVVERFDCDDAGLPIFLDAAGSVRPGATAAIGPVKWLAPESLWEPAIGMFLCPGSIYSPTLGVTVSMARAKEPKSTLLPPMGNISSR